MAVSDVYSQFVLRKFLVEMDLENVKSLSALMVKRVERHAKIEIKCVFKA